MSNENDEWIDTKEAARLLGRPAGTLCDWRLRGLGPPYYKCGKIRYLRSEVLAFRAAMRVEPGRKSEAIAA